VVSLGVQEGESDWPSPKFLKFLKVRVEAGKTLAERDREGFGELEMLEL
jgi:hypothetical protein